ncbi:MAG: protein translocase subunit SecF [Actinomycetota bacterium]|nr:protein translocase subunit SecF [Actinomycetota bacterium]
MRKFDFMGRKNTWFIISAVLITMAALAMLFKGIRPGIDFKGGTLLDLAFKNEITAADVRDVLREFDLSNSTIQQVETKEFLIRSKKLDQATQKEILAAFETKAKIEEIRYIQDVGPGWGEQVTRGALLALAASLATILIYITLRFEYKMAFSAVAALLHDVVITVGVYALLGREVTPNMIAGLLTILGYSLYDTIVVFHRILENTRALGKRRYLDMVSDSLNQVLARSINTSLTTIIPVFILLLFGGETLRDFALVLVVGIIAGTYSSIFIASPLFAIWKETEPRYAPSEV